MNHYEQWIDENYPDQRTCYGNCKRACQEMNAVFPELTITNGFVYDAMWGERMHWWLKNQQGNIVDPTARQFPAIMEYTEIDDNHPARKYPQERCQECGEYYYKTPELKGVMHTKACQSRYMAYLNSF